MLFDDPLGIEVEGDVCTICGKRLGEHDALAHIQHDGERISICCPLCLEAFERDKGHFSARRRARRLLRGEGTRV